MAKESVLVVAAHPDDEVLGCGATMAHHAKKGDRVHVLILAEGITSRAAKRDRNRDTVGLSKLSKAAKKANKILGTTSLRLNSYPDNRMDSVALLDVVKLIEEEIRRRKPRIIYTHHAGDVNVDHRITHEAVIAACRPQPGQPVKTVLSFEIPSSTEWQTNQSAPVFDPNWYVDVSKVWSLKTKALSAYKSEMRRWPHPRSLKAIEHLGRWRGSSIGCQAAEAFVLGRRIIVS